MGMGEVQVGGKGNAGGKGKEQGKASARKGLQLGIPRDLEGAESKQLMIERKIKEGAIKKMAESAEKVRLRELLKKRLRDAGWEEEMKEYCKEIIRNKCLEDLSVQGLVDECSTKSHAAVPDPIRSEIIERITSFLGT